MSSNPSCVGHSTTGLPSAQPFRIIRSIPLDQRRIADTVNIAIHNMPMDRFELAPPNEARLQFLPKSQDSFQVLTQEAARSKDPFANLANLAEQWLFPSAKHQQNKFALIPGLKENPASGTPERQQELGGQNIDAVMDCCEEELNTGYDSAGQLGIAGREFYTRSASGWTSGS